MNEEHLDLYTDYLMVTFGNSTATGLSSLLDGTISHDAFTRLLSKEECTSKHLWKHVKKTVRTIENDDGVVIFDDTIQEKNWMKENDLICWHYDHCKGRSVKGINLLNCLYYSNDVSIPVGFELVKKPIRYSEIKTKKEKRKSEITKNDLMRNMFDMCLANQIKFSWVLADVWFASTENMEHIKSKNKDFVMALKSNRLVALTKEDKIKKRYTRIDQLEWKEQVAITGWVKGLKFPVRLARQVFTNKDDSHGTLYLICSKLEADWNEMTTIYKKRWKVEVFHKSLKSNAAMAKSPARRVVSQSNHIFASILAVFKMECLKIKENLNHFALKSKIYFKAMRVAFDELQLMQAA